jgi:hypothetical protein
MPRVLRPGLSAEFIPAKKRDQISLLPGFPIFLIELKGPRQSFMFDQSGCDSGTLPGCLEQLS